jgi:type II secretory pathway component PulJ
MVTDPGKRRTGMILIEVLTSVLVVAIIAVAGLRMLSLCLTQMACDSARDAERLELHGRLDTLRRELGEQVRSPFANDAVVEVLSERVGERVLLRALRIPIVGGDDEPVSWEWDLNRENPVELLEVPEGGPPGWLILRFPESHVIPYREGVAIRLN